MFELLVAPVGANIYAAEIALVSYTLLILFRNILTGLRDVPGEVLDAAEGMGMTRTQQLLRVELPLALPAIIAGLRIAVVTTIALATIVYTIYDAGLGVPIHTALGEGPFKTELIAAGVLTIGLAILADALLVVAPARADAVGATARPERLGDRMHEFVEAFKFIAHNGAVAGQPNLPSLAHLALETLKVGAIGVADLGRDRRARSACWLGHLHRGSFVAINVGNIGRALPSLVVLAIGDAFLGLGLTVVELALVILAVPPIITNAYYAVDSVDPDLVDAARGMGMSEREVLFRVELPLSVPGVFAGIRTAAVFVISTTTIASLAGFSGSLGDIIANETSYHFSGVLGRRDLRGAAGARRSRRSLAWCSTRSLRAA